MASPKIVGYVTSGDRVVRGVVQGEGEEFSELDIWVPDPKTGAGAIVRNVPRRELTDGDEEFTAAKYGDTWHTVADS